MIKLILLLTCLMAHRSLAADSIADSIFDAIRTADAEQLRRLAASPANINARDEFGASPLMYAAAYGSVDQMRLLLHAGADVNMTTAEGATALMWATGDAAKVRALLAAGANPQATTKSGATALLAAAVRENTEVFRILLDAGADRAASMTLIPTTPIRVNLHQLAYTTNERTLRALTAGEPPQLSQLIVFPGSTPMGGLFASTSFSNRKRTTPGMADGIKALLGLGADAKADVRQLARVLAPLGSAAAFGDPEAIRLLLQSGANPNQPGTLGVTPLMVAASAEDQNLEVIETLLNAGAAVNTQDKLGRTALDWATMQGESEASRLLVKRGALPGEWRPPTIARTAPPLPLREAVSVALQHLQKSSQQSHQHMRCISCHHQSLPAMAIHLAAERGVQVETAARNLGREATLAMWRPSRENFHMGNCAIPGFLGNISYGLLSLAEEAVKPNAVTDAASSCLNSLQWPDGRWEGTDMRPPLAGKTPFVYTALAIRALDTYAVPARRAETAESIAKARAYLRNNLARDTQGESFRLLGLFWSKAPRPEVERQVKRLLALQRPDGGWSQRASMAPDAYATGQALYALHASGLKTTDAVYRRGVAFLLRTQLDDGTWFLRSRTLGFQPYFESGFPHGRDQFISAAATAWAAIALAYAL
jgi:ankyrin repeat protein